MLQKLWYDRPVRTQLLVAVAAINLLAALVAGAVSIFNTRTATQVEMEASLEVAQRFVAATLKDLSAQGKLDQLNQELQPDHLHFTDQGLALDAQWKLHVPLADGGNGDGDGKLWTEHSVQVLQPAHSHFLFHPLGLSRQ